MHECNEMQILKAKKKNKKIKEKKVTKDFEMKYKDHIRNTQLE